MMKKINRGFTLVEVVITTVIVGIFSIIGGVVYKKQVDNARYNEGLRLIQSLKEQEDLSLSFASTDTTKNPFFITGGVINTTYTIDRNAQKLGKFYIYPHHNRYFREFEIRYPELDELSRYNILGFGYIIEAYYPNKVKSKLTLKMVGSSEGSYTVIRE